MLRVKENTFCLPIKLQLKQHKFIARQTEVNISRNDLKNYTFLLKLDDMKIFSENFKNFELLNAIDKSFMKNIK